jgi:hypothetical protein
MAIDFGQISQPIDAKLFGVVAAGLGASIVSEVDS